jgi:hypothetical protein
VELDPVDLLEDVVEQLQRACHADLHLVGVLARVRQAERRAVRDLALGDPLLPGLQGNW